MVEVKSKSHPTVDSDLLNSAFAALINHHKGSATTSSSLLGDDLPVEVQFTLCRVPEKVSPRPYRLQIPHPLHKVLNKGETDQGLDDVEVCLFVKDGSKEWVKDLIEKFPNEMGYIKKVLTLTSLRKKNVQYKDRRDLLKRYDIFLADDRILPMLGKSIGKSFFQEKKQPVPIKLTREEALPFTVKRCLRSTFMWISAGTCISVRAGNTGMPLEHLVANANAIVENAVEHIPRKWSNVSSINIKTSQSVALPVYNKTREELEEISRLAKQGVKASSETKRPCPGQHEDEHAQKKKKVDKSSTAKSPLLKALKKSRKLNENDSTETDQLNAEENDSQVTKEPTKKESPVESSSKKAKKSSKTDKKTEPTEVVKKKRTEVDTSIKSKEKDPSKGKKNQEKKKQIEADKNFVPSKKFQGSKKGYVFRMGKEGLGYYVDVKPVPDKMALMALARMNKGGKNTGKNGGKSRKSTRRGR